MPIMRCDFPCYPQMNYRNGYFAHDDMDVQLGLVPWEGSPWQITWQGGQTAQHVESTWQSKMLKGKSQLCATPGTVHCADLQRGIFILPRSPLECQICLYRYIKERERERECGRNHFFPDFCLYCSLNLYLAHICRFYQDRKRVWSWWLTPA